MFDGDYPFFELLWTMFIFFAWVAWIMLLIRCYADIFRRQDLGGGMKTLWVVVLLFLPFLGVFIYVITQSNGMAERDLSRMQQSRQEFDEYVKSVATTGGGSGPAAEIEKAKQLLDSGALTPAEYDALKAKALA